MERRKKRAQRKGIDESYPTLELVIQKKKIREYANDRHLAKAPPHARVRPSSGESHPRTSVLSDKKMKTWGE